MVHDITIFTLPVDTVLGNLPVPNTGKHTLLVRYWYTRTVVGRDPSRIKGCFKGFLFDSFTRTAVEQGGKVNQELSDTAPVPKKTKFVIPRQLDPDSILDYTPYAEHTGNESQAEETMYVVTGLQVRRRSE